MKFGKTLLLGTLMTAGAFLATNAKDAQAAETYTIQPGDTLSEISVKFFGDIDQVEAIAKANNIENVDLIFAGEELSLDAHVEAAPAQEAAPVETAPVQEAAPAPVQEAPAPMNSSAAKEWIAQRESSGSYSATNGRYIGRYQLDASYLNGDYSPENQERVADAYVAGRYGSWEAAQAFWMANGWY